MRISTACRKFRGRASDSAQTGARSALAGYRVQALKTSPTSLIPQVELAALEPKSLLMRVCLVTHNVILGDGQGRVNYEITRLLLHHGHAVTLIADQVDPALLEQGAQWIPVHPSLSRPILAKVFDFARRADREIQRVRPQVDIVCANGVSCFESHDVNIAHFVHSTWYESPCHPRHASLGLNSVYQSAFTRINAEWERKAFSRAQCTVGVSTRVTEELSAIGVPEKRLLTIPNGVDLSEFHIGSSDRSRWDLPKESPVALFAGDVQSNRKNLDTILHALRLQPRWHLAIAGRLGNSPYPAMAERLGIASRTHFLGFRKDLPSLMQAANVFVFPSRYEPFGLVILEALACGCPVITSDTVGASQVLPCQSACSEVVRDGEDHASIARALSRFENFDSDTAKAARSIAENHTWTHMGTQYLELFHQLKASGWASPGSDSTQHHEVSAPSN